MVALNLYFFAAIASWQVFDPSSTSFMRAERMRLCGANVFTCKVDHRWVNYDQISRNLKRAVIASEDADFVSHSGWEVDAMLDAWEKNKRRGHVVAGGSTITQQLAKNLFLSGERHYLRKGEELVITWMLEFWLDKERILEIYLNSVEWGEGGHAAGLTRRRAISTSPCGGSTPAESPPTPPSSRSRTGSLLPNPAPASP